MVKSTMDPIDPDAGLMVAFQKGDQIAFEQLLDKYQRPIVNFIYRIVNNRAEAEELAQDVFLRIYRSRCSYTPCAPFAAWIYKIATNVSLKALEKRKRSPWQRARAVFDGADKNRQAEVRDPRPNAEGAASEAELAKMIRQAINSLPKNERVALLLRRYQDMSYRDIAGVMNCSESAVKTYLHRGKLHMRKRLLPYIQKSGA